MRLLERRRAMIGSNQGDPEPAGDGKVWCYYDVQDISAATRILNVTTNIKSIEVDGVQTAVSTTFQFSSMGEHLVKYTLTNDTYVNVPYANRGSSDAGQFRNCPTIKRCYVPKSVSNIAQTFRGNSSLEYFNFSDSGLRNIGNYAFSDCSKLTGDLEIPSLGGSLGNLAFKGAGFSRIINLGNVDTLEGSGSGQGCFSNMPNLILAELPESLTSLRTHVFYRSRLLATIVCRAVTPPVISGNPFAEASALSSIYVPDVSVDAYKAASGWSAKASIIKPLSQYEPQ